MMGGRGPFNDSSFKKSVSGFLRSIFTPDPPKKPTHWKTEANKSLPSEASEAIPESPGHHQEFATFYVAPRPVPLQNVSLVSPTSASGNENYSPVSLPGTPINPLPAHPATPPPTSPRAPSTTLAIFLMPASNLEGAQPESSASTSVASIAVLTEAEPEPTLTIATPPTPNASSLQVEMDADNAPIDEGDDTDLEVVEIATTLKEQITDEVIKLQKIKVADVGIREARAQNFKHFLTKEANDSLVKDFGYLNKLDHMARALDQFRTNHGKETDNKQRQGIFDKLRKFILKAYQQSEQVGYGDLSAELTSQISEMNKQHNSPVLANELQKIYEDAEALSNPISMPGRVSQLGKFGQSRTLATGKNGNGVKYQHETSSQLRFS